MDPKKLADQLNIDPKKVADQLNMDPKKVAQQLNMDPNHSKDAEKMLNSVKDWIYMAGAALYVLSPLDLVPEAVFGVFGLADDFLVILFVVLYFYSKRRKSTTQEYKNKFKVS